MGSKEHAIGSGKWGITLNKAIKLYVDILYNFCVDVYNYMRSVQKNTRTTYTKLVKSVSPEV